MWNVAEPPIGWAVERVELHLYRLGQVGKGVASPSLAPGLSLAAQIMWGGYWLPSVRCPVRLTCVLPVPGVPDVAGPPRAGGEDGRAVHHARE